MQPPLRAPAPTHPTIVAIRDISEECVKAATRLQQARTHLQARDALQSLELFMRAAHELLDG
ncbi:hypothetical protein CFN79_19110 [Chromobacterium vaccinii]|nr:hypothetical protein CFN79_19110 [Chromobacterium vaccinii]